MSETPNFHLYITDDSQEHFMDWREKMNGKENSNMTKIDAALGAMGKKSGAVSSVLRANAWIGVAAPFTQTIEVDGLDEEISDQNGYINVSKEATFEERAAARIALLCVTGQGKGSLTISADGEMPDIDIPVTIIMLG